LSNLGAYSIESYSTSIMPICGRILWRDDSAPQTNKEQGVLFIYLLLQYILIILSLFFAVYASEKIESPRCGIRRGRKGILTRAGEQDEEGDDQCPIDLEQEQTTSSNCR
jgi:hypothetical protein